MTSSCPDPSAHPAIDCPDPSVHDANNQPTLRRWQRPRRFFGRYILGWLATDDLCRGVCSRGCTTPFHKENGELSTDESMDAHIRFLRQDVRAFIVDKFDLDCVGKRVVYVDRAHTGVSWAIVVSDSGGESPEERRIPSPKVVDEIKRYLVTDAEPRWFECID